MALGRRWAPELLSAAAAITSVVSDSVRPHRWQPTTLPCPWDSPGKNTGVGCHFLLQCMKVKVKSLSYIRLLATPWTAAYQASPPMGFSRQEHWNGLPLPSPELLNNHPIFIRVILSVPFDSAAAHLVTNHIYSCRYKIIHYSFHFIFQ